MGWAADVFRGLPVGAGIKRPLKFAYFWSCAVLGLVRSPALSSLDRRVEPHLRDGRGVFLEVGGNDGLSQSNTWYFERYRNWTGLLIEPVPALARYARVFRRAPTANVALGRSDGGFLELAEQNEMTTADLSRLSANRPRIRVPMRRLSSVIDEYGLGPIDFFSLDVEGFECEVLRGLDLDRHRPAWLLAETADIQSVLSVLNGRYALQEKMSHHDYLLKALDPV